MNAIEMLNEKILEKLNQGIIPWKQSWKSMQRPRNAFTNRPYRGLNTWLLSGYEQSGWLTFNQVKKFHGSVNAGEKASYVFFFTTNYMRKTKDEEGNVSYETVELDQPVMRTYAVFNVMQCYFPKEIKEKLYDHVETKNNPIESCESIINNYQGMPQVVPGEPAYYPLSDIISMPTMERFNAVESYYAVLFHEMTHSTGHKDRLNRFKSIYNESRKDYGFEELVAEFGASYLLNHVGIEQLEENAAYIQGWAKAIKDDKYLLMKAASQGEKAYNYITGGNYEN